MARERVAQRLRALYVNGDGAGAVEIILGAKSLDDILTRLDVAQRVGEQDATVLGDVKQFRREVQARRAKLAQARKKQAELVADKAAQKRYADQQLAESRQLLASRAGRDPGDRGGGAAPAGAAPGAGPRQARRPAHGGPGRPSVAAADAQTEYGLDNGGYDLPPSKYTGVVGIAMQYLGVPYVWGGGSPSGFDCSGSSMYVYAQVGVSLPHNAAMQYGYGVPVGYDQLEAGDLVFFHGLGHMPASTSAATSSSTRRTRATSSGSRRSRRTTATSAPAGCCSPATSSRTSPPARSARIARRFGAVQRFDLRGEMVEAHAPLELERRRDLALLQLEVARQHREPLDLLEAAAVAIDVVHDPLHDRHDPLVACELRDGGLDLLLGRPLARSPRGRA